VVSRASAAPATPLKLSYASYADLDSRLAGDTPLLGAVAFGSHPPPAAAHAAFPFVWVDMPALRGEGFCEIWESGQPVESVESNGVRGARNEHVLFGALQVPECEGLEAAGRLAYCRVFEAIDALGFPYLLRAWNYFPGINDDADGVERYRRFNVGRHDAFAARGRTIGVDMPAACALGCREGPLTVYFIAGKARGLPLENPRQVSAYRYPERYGPRTPTFSRAMLMQPAGVSGLAISGTASIVGHETRHVGDADAQIEETLANIRALMDAAGYAVSPSPAAGAGLLLKAYLRRPDDLRAVEDALGRTFGKAGVVYLQADICRSELLVEIEGLYTPRI
jgi:chorismate lyase/3-hydroxybenzoate synthase